MPFVQGDLVTLSDVKTHLRIPTTDTSNDTQLQGFIDAASAIVGYEVGPVTTTSFTETHVPRGSRVIVDQVPIVSVTTITEYIGRTAYTLSLQPPGSTTDNWGYSIDLPDSGVIVRRDGAGIEIPFWGTPVVVTYTAGLASTPPDVKMAVLEDLRGLWQQTQQGQRPGGTSGSTVDAWTVGPLRLFPRLAAVLERAGRTQSIA